MSWTSARRRFGSTGRAGSAWRAAPEDTPSALWVDGEVVDRALVRGHAVYEAELAGERWHAVVLESHSSSRRRRHGGSSSSLTLVQ